MNGTFEGSFGLQEQESPKDKYQTFGFSTKKNLNTVQEIPQEVW